MTVSSMLDSAGRRRSPATLPGFHAGRAPRNKGMRYPADPPTVEEIICVMRHVGDNAARVAAARHDRDALARRAARSPRPSRSQSTISTHSRGSVLVRHGKGGTPTRGRDGLLGLGAAAAVAR